MNSNLTFDVGLAAKLKIALSRNDWTEQQIDAACEGDKLGQFRQVLLGHAEIKQIEHVINCDADPFVPSGWKVEEHQKGGQWKFDAAQIELYLADAQKKGTIEGNKLRKLLAGKLVLNACVLDYLLAHRELIPEEWKGKAIFFWGTIYRSSGGRLYVRCLCWDGGRWSWGYYWLGIGWDGDDPAALRAS